MGRASALQAPGPPLFQQMRKAASWYRQRGLRWILRRARDEFLAPRFAVVRKLREAFQTAPAAAGEAGDPDTLFFFFDLQLCPLAFDIATYMAAAELERRRLGIESVHVVFVPGRDDGLRLELPAYEATVDVETRRWRLHNLVLPVTGLLPACSGHTFCATRGDAEALFRSRARHVFPSNWQPALPVAPVARTVRDAARNGIEIFPLLKAPDYALRQAARYFAAHTGGRKPVVITLRQYAFTPARNSDIEAWADFADRLDAGTYAAIFVLDTDTSLDALPEALRRHAVLQAASWNIHLRMAIYERAYLNLAVVHGPMELCWYNESCRYLVFCPVNTAPLTGEAVLEREGFGQDKALPFARPWQRWIWEPDSEAVISREFARLQPVLDALP